MKTRLLLIGIVVCAIAAVQPLGAAVVTANLTVSAVVANTARLTVSSTTVSFPDADPDTVLSIPAAEGPITIRAQAKTGGASTVTLTLQAAGDLVSGSDTIPIPNVTWTVGGVGFVPGTMSTATAQSVATWTGSGNRTGTQTFALANSWAYATGSYSAAATYTLTAP